MKDEEETGRQWEESQGSSIQLLRIMNDKQVWVTLAAKYHLRGTFICSDKATLHSKSFQISINKFQKLLNQNHSRQVFLYSDFSVKYANLIILLGNCKESILTGKIASNALKK